MAHQKYFVDWADQSFPKIRPIEMGSEYATPQTLWEAKREIVRHFEHLRDHAKDRIAETRALRVEDVLKGDEL
jgi:hypothetical protein